MAAPEPRIEDPVGVSPAALARFDTLCSRMTLIAEGVNTITDPALRERAFYELVGIINPAPQVEAGGESTPLDDGDTIADWILEHAPGAWRDALASGTSFIDGVIGVLDRGVKAWTDLLLVKRALIDHGGFTGEQVDGDLAALVRDLAADPPVSSPEVEKLAAQLRAEAEPGETAAQVALRVTVACAASRRSVEQLENWLNINLPDDAAKIDGTLNHTAVDVAIGLLRQFRQSLLTPQEKVDERERPSD